MPATSRQAWTARLRAARFNSSETMAAKLKGVVDPTVGGEKSPGMTGRLEPLHLSFSSSRRLVRNLGPIVKVAALAVLDPGQEFLLRGSIVLALISCDGTRDVRQAREQLL
jgi:hypothetical protein